MDFNGFILLAMIVFIMDLLEWEYILYYLYGDGDDIVLFIWY